MSLDDMLRTLLVENGKNARFKMLIKAALFAKEEKVAMFTIGMKSKTAVGKNEKPQTGSWNECIRYVPSM
jgi:hypothetical protein